MGVFRPGYPAYSVHRKQRTKGAVLSEFNIKAVFKNVFNAPPHERIFKGETRPQGCRGYLRPAHPGLESCIRCGNPEATHAKS
jgi:hypothetical protein